MWSLFPNLIIQLNELNIFLLIEIDGLINSNTKGYVKPIWLQEKM